MLQSGPDHQLLFAGRQETGPRLCKLKPGTSKEYGAVVPTGGCSDKRTMKQGAVKRLLISEFQELQSLRRLVTCHY